MFGLKFYKVGWLISLNKHSHESILVEILDKTKFVNIFFIDDNFNLLTLLSIVE